MEWLFRAESVRDILKDFMERGSYWLYEAHTVLFSFGDQINSPFVSVFPVWRVDRGAFLLCMTSIQHLGAWLRAWGPYPPACLLLPRAILN